MITILTFCVCEYVYIYIYICGVFWGEKVRHLIFELYFCGGSELGELASEEALPPFAPVEALNPSPKP